MRLIKLMLSGFRSWERVSFEFTEGLTVFCGVNGAGKSSLRLGAQYAITGAVPGFKKDELVNTHSREALSVELHMLTPDNKKFAIRRTLGRTMLTLDGVDCSVRENAYLARLKVALNHTFLAPDHSAFVDVQDHKRKEMLYALIPEVEMLRAVCVPKLRDCLKRAYQKKVQISQNIYTVEAVVAEQKAALNTARRNYEREIERIANLKATMAAQLPYDEPHMKSVHKRLAEIKADITKFSAYVLSARKWVDHAVYTNTVNAQVGQAYDAMNTELRRTREKIAAYEEMFGHQSGDVPCTSCKNPLVCATCNTKVKAENTVADSVHRHLTAHKAQEAQLLIDVAKQEKLVTKAQIVSVADINQTRSEAIKAETIVNKLRSEQIELDGQVQKQLIAQRNIDAVSKMQLDAGTAETMREHIEEVQGKIQKTEALLVRKRRVLEIMDSTERRITKAAEAMNTTLPAIYFDHFLTRLSASCNYLLGTISTMSVEMSADENGISIVVDGMKFHQLSTGEKQRVRIATTLAFSLLSKQSDTLFIDEVFDTFLDAEGVEVLAHLLSTVMRKFYPKLIVVSHQPYLTTALNPDHVLFIEKDETQNSRIVNRVDLYVAAKGDA